MPSDYKIQVAKKSKLLNKVKSNKVLEFKVSLQGTSPVVWRSFLAHEFIELPELHMLIQMSMGWQAYHLYEFKINDKSYTDAESALEMKAVSDEGVLLCDILGSSKKFSYIYDFGDGWKHEVQITKTLEHDPRVNYPVCTGGENACPPEDCGGPPGFERLKQTLAGKDSEEKDELLSWVGGYYNPSTFDPNFVNRYFLWADV